MEEKKFIKISLGTLLLLIFTIVLLITIIAIGLFIFNSKMEDKKESSDSIAEAGKEEIIEKQVDEEKKENVVETTSKNIVENNSTKKKVENKVENKTENDDSSSNESIGKIVENRSYIYNAQYNAENIKDESYKTNDGVSHSISEIVVPYININSDDGRNSNSELENAYNNFVNEFKICSENKNSYINVSYKTYTTSNIVSILVTIERGKENNISNEYIAYNFDVISGLKLTYEQIYGIAGINNIEECIKNNIEELEEFKKYSANLKNNNDITNLQNEVDACQKQMYTYYQEDLLNNKLVYFLDSNLKLNVKLKIVLPKDESGSNQIIEKIVAINT